MLLRRSARQLYFHYIQVLLVRLGAGFGSALAYIFQTESLRILACLSMRSNAPVEHCVAERISQHSCRAAHGAKHLHSCAAASPLISAPSNSSDTPSAPALSCNSRQLSESSYCASTAQAASPQCTATPPRIAWPAPSQNTRQSSS